MKTFCVAVLSVCSKLCQQNKLEGLAHHKKYQLFFCAEEQEAEYEESYRKPSKPFLIYFI